MHIFQEEEDLVSPERKEMKSIILKLGVGERNDLRKKTGQQIHHRSSY